MHEYLSDHKEGALLKVRLIPNAGRDQIAGVRADALLIKVKAPAIEGRANKGLCKTVAKAVGVAPTRVGVVKGHKSRDKTLLIRGRNVGELKERIQQAGDFN